MAEATQIALYVKNGTPLYNQNSVSKLVNWNGKVFRNRVHNVWAGKYKDFNGIHRTKQVPSSIQSETEALDWFATWVVETFET